jgi:WhiB family redox-sensing transcriptional regulator
MNPLKNINKKHHTTNTPKTDIHTKAHKDHWTEQANCKGKQNKFFPKQHKDISYITEARAICKQCPVLRQCRDYALEFPAADMHGVWAMMTSRQIDKEQKRLGIRPSRTTIAGVWGDNR